MSEQHTRLLPSERLHALVRVPRRQLGDVPPKHAITCIASNSYGNYSLGQMTRGEMITLAREVCDANNWKYSGSR